MSRIEILSEHSQLGAQEGKLVRSLVEILESNGLRVEGKFAQPTGVFRPDYSLVLQKGKERYHLLVELKGSGMPSSIYEIIGRAQVASRDGKTRAWVLGAPYISPEGADLCFKGGISYIDLCGNFDLRFGPFIFSKRTAQVPTQERASLRSVFSPKSSRVSLALLLNPNRNWTQRNLAGEMDLSIGLVSRTIRELARRGFVEAKRGQWRLLDRDGLLGAWLADYRKRKNPIHEFFGLASLAELEERLDKGAFEGKYRYALAGESGAKYRAPFAESSRLVFYCDHPRLAADHLKLKRVETGANVRIVTPPDEGVFYKTRKIELGAPSSLLKSARTIANDIYLYLELAGSEARGKEQADHLMEVLARESLKVGLSTADEARFHDFLKARDRAYEAERNQDWKTVIESLDPAFRHVRNLSDENVQMNVRSATFSLWRALLEFTLQSWRWDDFRGKSIAPKELVDRVSREIPSDEAVLELYPPMRYNSALVHYLLGTRHAIVVASHGDSNRREQHARILADHFKIAGSPYTQGSREVGPDVQRVLAWLKKYGEFGMII